MPLTGKRLRFAREYLVDRCGAAAYQRAGYAATGHAAEANASRLLRNAEVVAEIARLEAERAERTRVTADRVLAELGLVAFSNADDFQVREDGTLTVRPGVNPDILRTLASVKRTTRTQGGVTTHKVDFRLWSKTEALRLALQHLGLLRDGARVDVAANAEAEPRVDLSALTDEELEQLSAINTKLYGSQIKQLTADVEDTIRDSDHK